MDGWIILQNSIARARKAGWTVHGWVAALGGPSEMCVGQAQISYVDAQYVTSQDSIRIPIDYDVDQNYKGCMKAVQLQLDNS
jgi:hypothetical protein